MFTVGGGRIPENVVSGVAFLLISLWNWIRKSQVQFREICKCRVTTLRILGVLCRDACPLTSMDSLAIFFTKNDDANHSLLVHAHGPYRVSRNGDYCAFLGAIY